MKCPKCGKKLEIIRLRVGEFRGHSYTLEQVLKGKPMCDYSQKLK